MKGRAPSPAALARRGAEVSATAGESAPPPREPTVGVLALGLLAALFGCGPSVSDVRREVAQGHLDAQWPHLFRDSVLAPLAARVDRERPALGVLSDAEGPLLAASVEEALAQGAVVAAAGRLEVAALAARSGSATTDLVALSDAVMQAALAGDADTVATVGDRLARAWEHDPGRARRYRLLSDEHAVLARYSSATIDATFANQAGVDRAMVASILRRLDTEYVVPVDWTRATQSAAARLGMLPRTDAARERWPALQDAVFTGFQAPDVDAALAALDAAIRVGAAASVPESVVLDEWTTGALASLDPWTRAVWPAEVAAWSEGHAGSFLGVGLDLRLDEAGQVRVVQPWLDAPAWASGIHQDDVLEVVSDETGSLRLEDFAPEERLPRAEAALRGAANSTVTLAVRRGGAVLSFSMVRGEVVVPTVAGWSRGTPADPNAWNVFLDETPPGVDIAYIHIERFRPTTEAAFDALLEPFIDEVDGLVLDLRGNPGGDVNSAVQIADRFVADGWLATLSGRVLPDTGPDIDPETGKRLAEWNEAIPGHLLEGVPVVVVVDEQSASAAEVLAGALQERAGAKVVGTETWGKGLAQALRPSEDGRYAVQFTNVAWTLPSGRRLARAMDGGGILPDVLFSTGPAADYQLSVARERRSAVTAHADGTPLRPPSRALREGLPVLGDDPAVRLAQMVVLATIYDRAETQ